MSFRDWSPQLQDLWNEFMLKRNSLSKEEVYLLFESFNSLSDKSQEDSLTSLMSFKNWSKKLQALKVDKISSVIMIDIDNFKITNDQYGHLEGNHLLKILSRTLKNIWNKDHDLLCRFGGDEFLIFSEGGHEENYKKSLELQDKLDLHSISVSIGIDEVENIENILIHVENADKAMYFSKVNGKKQISVFKEKLTRNLLNFRTN